MPFWIESILLAVCKLCAFAMRLLPMRLALAVGKVLGYIASFVLIKKRRVVYSNLKIAFGHDYTPQQLRRMTRDVFGHLGCSVIEFMCLPKIIRRGLDKYVDVVGRENVDEAVRRGKGVIFLATHGGSWEFASIAGSLFGYPYHIFVNAQPKTPLFDQWLNKYRRMAQAGVINAQTATKDIIRALKKNEIVSVVLDQGGAQGMRVPFLGKTASMSTGAMRMALKYGCALCPAWIIRQPNGRHILEMYPALDMVDTGDERRDVTKGINQAVAIFEGALRRHPTQYLWFYKVYKYSTQANVLIIDDGRVGHLRQSQAVASALSKVLADKGKRVTVNAITVKFKKGWQCSLFYVLARVLPFLRREYFLKSIMSPESAQALSAVHADFVISCGSKAAGVNWLMADILYARSIQILTPGILDPRLFTWWIMPTHDQVKIKHARKITTRAALNVITPAYLKEQVQKLENHFSHLKGNARFKIGVLLGGNTKGVELNEAKARSLLKYVKEAAMHFNADVLLTTSRRTPAAVDAVVARELKGFERCALCIIANDQNIPSAVGGILGLSDIVLVSGESISMVSEAVASGKKTIVFSLEGTTDSKYERFSADLADEGYILYCAIKDLPATIALAMGHKFTPKPLQDQQVLMKAFEHLT